MHLLQVAVSLMMMMLLILILLINLNPPNPLILISTVKQIVREGTSFSKCYAFR